MSGGSLGLRTGSYGSLQQHLQNGVALPVQTAPPIGRKPSKMLLSNSREKEKFLQWLCKMAIRRKVMMPLLVLVSMAVFIMLMSAISKDSDEDAPQGSDAHSRSSRHFQTVGPLNGINALSHRKSPPLPSVEQYRKSPPLPSVEQHNKSYNKPSSSLEMVSATHENKTLPLPPVARPLPPVVRVKALPLGHPCEHFALPPPPADRKRTGPRPCPVCYLPIEQAMAHLPNAPSVSPVLKSLTYVSEESPVSHLPFGGSPFGGYPSLKQRDDSFDIKESMHVHCGFVKGNTPGQKTGFDIDEIDLLEMEQCHGIVVASAIFGNYDIIQQPKNISDAAKKNVCFYMFVDEETEAYLKNSSTLNSTNRVGLWRVVVVHNLPYNDARRNGKVPKLLLHRIFPNARFSIWIDGKLELIVDPYQILERFLWRTGDSFAISRHYKRFDVLEEAEANKAAGKYDNASIDYQIEFYKKEGLTPYTSAKLPITSDVPEGCVILREHIPITNLFTCLWFNEVDRFTSRDQISFSTVRDKIMSRVDWSVNMFLDCERRNFVVQGYHRDVLELMSPPAAAIHPPPPLTNLPPAKASPEVVSVRDKAEVVPDRDRVTRSPPRRVPAKRGRERRTGSRRHRTRTFTGRDTNSF